MASMPSMLCAITFVGLGAGLLLFSQALFTDGSHLDGLASVCRHVQLTPMLEPVGFHELWTLPLIGAFEPLYVPFSVLRVLGFAPFDTFSPHFKG